MKRLTLDNTFEMNMHELALNQVYIGEDRWARYRNGPEDEVSACDLIRTAAGALDVELPMLNDGALSDLLVDWLQYGAEEPEGVLAILYRALWAMAELRDKLSHYEDTGLEPEEMLTGKELAEIACAINLLKEYQSFGPADHFRELAQAEKDGRLVMLPDAKYTDADGEKALQKAMWVCGNTNNPVTRYTADAIAEKLCREARDENPPLTLEALREIDEEPVWIDSPCIPNGGCYIILREFGITFEKWTSQKMFHCEDYGKTWLAYRRKPEER